MRKKAKQLGFVDGILFSKKETEEKESDKDEPKKIRQKNLMKSRNRKSTGIYAIFHISDQCIFAAQNIRSSFKQCTDQSA